MTTATSTRRTKFPECWVFDFNRRVYPKGSGMSSSPIWREHWRKVKIIGETSRSWKTKCGRNIPKKGGSGVCFSQNEIDNNAWLHENRYHIVRRVERCTDVKAMKAIAELVGYKSDEVCK